MVELAVSGENPRFVDLFIAGSELSPRERAAAAAEVFEGLSDPTPEDFVAYWGVRWGAFGTLLKRNVPFSAIDRCHAEIRALRKQGRTLVFRPEDITLPDLGIIHPEMKSWSTYPRTSIHSDSRYGWIDIEDVVHAPNLRTTTDELKEVAEKTGRYGMTLETYIIASQDHYDRKGGEHFDNNYQTTSRLPGSLYSSFGPEVVVDASFVGPRLLVNSYGYASISSTLLGARFEGVKLNK